MTTNATILARAVEAYEREAGKGSCDRAAMALALEAAGSLLPSRDEARRIARDAARTEQARPKCTNRLPWCYGRVNGGHCTCPSRHDAIAEAVVEALERAAGRQA